MSLAVPIERWANRLYLQQEPSFGAASDEPVREFTGKTRFSYGPIHGQALGKVGLNRVRLEQVSAVTHWQGACDAEYRHGEVAAQVFTLLFDLVSKATNSPSEGLTTYVFRLRRLDAMKTAKLGLEYEPTGPFYVMHGVAVDSIRLTATTRSRAKFKFDFKAREMEQIPSTHDYTHPDLTQYGQFNFQTETVGGPCYEDGHSGLSCRVVSRETLLGTEDGFLITTEDGHPILLESEHNEDAPQVGSAFTVFVNGEAMLATEISLEGREPKTPARFNAYRKAGAMKPGAPGFGGELALYHNGDEVPNTVAADAYASIRMVADFGGGRGITVSLPRVKFGAGTPDLVGKGELVYRAPFSALEPSADDTQESRLTLVI